MQLRKHGETGNLKAVSGMFWDSMGYRKRLRTSTMAIRPMGFQKWRFACTIWDRLPQKPTGLALSSAFLTND